MIWGDTGIIWGRLRADCGDFVFVQRKINCMVSLYKGITPVRLVKIPEKWGIYRDDCGELWGISACFVQNNQKTL